ncbi:hypothetical protein SLEP1_g54935 [Rubroshorea leprosula]|uniref:Uncharacterized protein n=1 Tax=Rubroshorea leprosula TaxID=152421 RepID=A0AAV5MGG4_9ROSI|nr:hypothetical protein SLEP1_g54935 [Rubroshorea leprosula]
MEKNVLAVFWTMLAARGTRLLHSPANTCFFIGPPKLT